MSEAVNRPPAAASRPGSGNPVLHEWLMLGIALALLAILLGSGPAGTAGGQLPHVDGLLLGLIEPAAPVAGVGTTGAGDPLAGSGLARLAAFPSAVLAALVVLATMAALYRARPGLATVAITALALAACLALAAACAALASRWWPPAGTMTAVLLAAPLWNWRRLAVATRALAADADSLRHAPDLVPPSIRHHPTEAVARDLQPLRDASARIRVLRRLLHALIDKLPHPAIVTNGAGEVLLSNRVARTAFASMPIEQQSITPWMRVEFGDHAGLDRLPPADGPGLHGIEAIDRNGRHWLADIDHARESVLPLIFLIQFTDITPLRLAESARNASLARFGRALRTEAEPLLETVHAARARGELPDWADAIESHARSILAIAEKAVASPAPQRAPESRPRDATTTQS